MDNNTISSPEEKGPVKLVSLVCLIPTDKSTPLFVVNNFEVPLIEEIMFRGDTQLKKSDLGAIKDQSPTPLNPVFSITGYAQKVEGYKNALRAFLCSDQFQGAVATLREKFTPEGVEKQKKEAFKHFEKEAVKVRQRLIQIKKAAFAKDAVTEDITGLSEEEAAKVLKNFGPKKGAQ
jgi:hypothetical protein